jgi:hypothetical protein
MKDNKMGEACSMQKRDEKSIKNISRKPERKRTFRDIDIDGSIILKWILKK